ncbi:MAG: hypothetical protein PWQ88_92 [Candidatus Methanomethylophilaceae archaeon]|jgi:Uncharacterized protein involved in the oxidation of intracellular sulfur|nr:hypothetical protein [Candidatus Methanomethylophilaceae archaeon]MDI3541767.1 hypothetical protein [Candidatus Methanomethylophilaceae archaeon]HIJ00077.1 sulfur reduction protein DsrE [Candidatus Methanomethylophilaceae archaeon]
MAKSVALLITKPPYGTEDAFAGIREAMALAVSGLVERTVVLLIGEGGLNALTSQRPEALSMPSNLEAVNDLLALEVETYVVKEDLDRILPDAELIEGVRPISWDEARGIIAEVDLVTTF